MVSGFSLRRLCMRKAAKVRCEVSADKLYNAVVDHPASDRPSQHQSYRVLSKAPRIPNPNGISGS
jgi:hypothetical protein